MKKSTLKVLGKFVFDECFDNTPKAVYIESGITVNEENCPRWTRCKSNRMMWEAIRQNNLGNQVIKKVSFASMGRGMNIYDTRRRNVAE